MEGNIGFIMPFAGNFVPSGWLTCEGQQLTINGPYTALYAIIGTWFGGDGKTVFNLPDLRGRAVVGISGAGAAANVYPMGQAGGSTSFTMNTSTMPSHGHMISATLTPPAASGMGDQETPNGNVYAVPSLSDSIYSENTTAMMQSFVGIASMGMAGNLTPAAVNSQDPVLGISYIICYDGYFLPNPA